MSGEDFEGQDAGYVPENPAFPQNYSDERDVENVFDQSGFPPPQPDESFDGHDAGNVAEDLNSPVIHFGGPDVGELPQNLDSAQEHNEEHYDARNLPENVGSSRKQGSNVESKGSEIKRWPGWPGENVFRMLVPAQKIGSIIGRKGEFIKKITEETKARIKILDGAPGISERAVSLLSKFPFFLYSVRN